MKKIVSLAWLMVALILFSGCEKVGKIIETSAPESTKVVDVTEAKPKSKSGLEIVTPESVGISSDDITTMLSKYSEEDLALHSIMILKNGKIVAEGYEANYDEDSLQRMYSVSKSFVSIAVGLLIDEGKIALDDTIGQYFEDYVTGNTHSWILDTTIEDLLKMASPHNRGVYVADTPDWIASFFSTTPGKAPGTKFYYDTCGTYLLGVIVERLTGKDFLEYAKEKALNKIGFSENSWCVNSPEGYAWGGSGVMCTTGDLAKVAMLVMNDGVYNGEQILPREYIKAAKSFQILDDDSGTPYYGHGYGYQIWMVDKKYGGEGAFAFLGMGDQLAICIPEKDLVFVCTSDNQGSSTSRLSIFNLFKRYVIDKVEDNPLAENQTDYATMVEALNSIKLPVAYSEIVSKDADLYIGKTYKSQSSSDKFTSVKIEITEDSGVLKYSTARGDKELLFGIGKNVVGILDEPQYYGTAIRTPKGVGYRTACSGGWTNDYTFVLKVQVIDDYLANMIMTFKFDGDTMKLTTKYTAEWFLSEYSMNQTSFVRQ